MKARKILSAIMAIAVVICMLSVGVYAADVTDATEVSTLEDLQAALAADNDLPIVITKMIVIPAGETVVLDLNGKTVTVPESEGNHIYAIDNQGDLTLKDSKDSGSITARGIYNGYNNNSANAKLTVESGKYVGMDTDGGAAIYNGAELIINGGEFYGGRSAITNAIDTADTTINGGTFGGAYVLASGTAVSTSYIFYNTDGILTINDADIVSGFGGITCAGGTVVIEDGNFMPTGWVGYTSSVVYVEAAADVTINGGTFKMNYPADEAPNSGEAVASYYNGTLSITGGEFYAHFDNVSPVQLSTGSVITGGTYMNHSGEAISHSYVTNFIKDGYELGEDGTVVESTPATPVAKIGDDYYTDLQTAINEAANVATEQALVTVELLPGEFTLGTFTLPNMEYVTVKGAADKKSVIKDTLITNTGKSTDNIAHIAFDGIAFDNSRIYLNGWTAGMNFADWKITNCEFRNLESETSVGGVVQFNLSSSMIVGQWGPYNDVALDGFTFTNNVVEGAHCNGVCSAINSQAMEGAIVIENNIFNDIDFNAIQLQNVPETATVSIKNNTLTGIGAQMLHLNNNLADVSVNKNVFVATSEEQLYMSHVSTEINASENFFGIGTNTEDAVFNENYAEQMNVNSGVSSPVVESYYTDVELTEKVMVELEIPVDPAFGETLAVARIGANEEDYELVLLGAIATLDYKNVGFEITFNDEVHELKTKTVYTKITSTDAETDEVKDYTSKELGGTETGYVFGQMLGFALDDMNKEFTCRLFAINLNDEYVFGKTWTIPVAE